MRQDEVNGQDPAEGNARQGDITYVERIEQGFQIRYIRPVIRFVFRLPMAADIVGDHLVAVAKVLNLRLPHPMIDAAAVDPDDGAPRAFDLIMNFVSAYGKKFVHR